MSDPLATTRHLGLPFIAAAQAQKHVTHNEALKRLDAIVQLAVLDASLAGPPSTPAEGDRYIVAEDATGGWADHDGEIAHFIDGAWEFAAAAVGWTAYDAAADALLVHTEDGWKAAGAHLGAVDRFGVNAVADDTNRLSVRSNAVLFAPIAAADGGTGDVRFVVDKEADGDTASLLFQSGWSGRAEIGLAGDTDFVLKVSPDGSAWTEAIRVDKDSGLAAILYDNGTSGLTATTVQDALDELAAGGGGGDGGAVASVFGRTGTVVAATSDYDASQVDNDSAVSGSTVKDALDALATSLSGKQAGDADLTAIAGLTPSNDDVIQRKAGAWTNRTPAQLKSDLALTKSDVGLGGLDNLQQLPLSYLDTDDTLAADSDAKVASQKAIRAYVDAAVAGGGGGAATGTQTLWLPADDWSPLITNGCGVSYGELATNRRIRASLDFDTSTQEFATWLWRPPKRWDKGSLTFLFVWFCTGGSAAQTVQMSLSAVAIGDGDTSDAAFGTPVAVSDTWIADADTHVSAESSAITVAGTPADGDVVALKLQRDVSSDDLGVDAQVLGAVLFWTSDAGTDD